MLRGTGGPEGELLRFCGKLQEQSSPKPCLQTQAGGSGGCALSHGAEVPVGSPRSRGKASQPGRVLRSQTLARGSPVLPGLFASAASELSPLCTPGLALRCRVGVRKQRCRSYPAGRIFSLGFPPRSCALSVAPSSVPSICRQQREQTLLRWRKASQSY